MAARRHSATKCRSIRLCCNCARGSRCASGCLVSAPCSTPPSRRIGAPKLRSRCKSFVRCLHIFVQLFYLQQPNEPCYWASVCICASRHTRICARSTPPPPHTHTHTHTHTHARARHMPIQYVYTSLRTPRACHTMATSLPDTTALVQDSEGVGTAHSPWPLRVGPAVHTAYP